MRNSQQISLACNEQSYNTYTTSVFIYIYTYCNVWHQQMDGHTSLIVLSELAVERGGGGVRGEREIEGEREGGREGEREREREGGREGGGGGGGKEGEEGRKREERGRRGRTLIKYACRNLIYALVTNLICPVKYLHLYKPSHAHMYTHTLRHKTLQYNSVANQLECGMNTHTHTHTHTPH